MPMISANICDVGKKRKSNQDSIYSDLTKRVFIVADGMGGHNGGDVASYIAINEISKHIIDNFDNDPTKTLNNSITIANQTIMEQSKKHPSLQGMGTTTTACYFKQTTLHISNVGDSRTYLINKKCIYQLSKDHSLIQEKIHAGIYTRKQACNDRQNNVLIRAIGVEEDVEIDNFSYRVLKNDIFLMCSDGLHSKVSEKDIIHTINKMIPNPSVAKKADLEKTVKVLASLAFFNGGNDNISIILIVAK